MHTNRRENKRRGWAKGCSRRVLSALAIWSFILTCGVEQPWDTRAASVSPEATFTLEEVVPTGRTEVEVLVIQFTQRANELSRKLLVGTTQHKEWFVDFAKTRHEEGKPLPYHPNFGISEKEYSEYLAEMAKREFAVAQKVEFVFHQAKDILTIEDGTPNSPLSHLRINLRTRSLDGPVGEISQSTWEVGEKENTPLGPYEGYQWKFERMNESGSNITVFSLEILRVRKTGRIVWIVKDSLLEDKKFTLSRQSSGIFHWVAG